MREMQNVDREIFEREIVPAYEPVVLRGLAAQWPSVAAARRSPAEAANYLARFDRGASVEAFIGPPEIKGRFFYRDDMSGFNFDRRKGGFGEVLRYILSIAEQSGAPSVYIGAS